MVRPPARNKGLEHEILCQIFDRRDRSPRYGQCLDRQRRGRACPPQAPPVIRRHGNQGNVDDQADLLELRRRDILDVGKF